MNGKDYRVIYNLVISNNMQLRTKRFKELEEAVTYYKKIVDMYMGGYGVNLDIALYDNKDIQIQSLRIKNREFLTKFME